jgi:hypothetical protein
LPVPSGLDMPRPMLVAVPAICVLVLAIAMVRVVRVKPVVYSSFAFTAVALAGGALQLGDLWWNIP